MSRNNPVQVESDSSESLEEFLVRLGKSLTDQDGADASLAQILSMHILKTHPTNDAVVEAKTAILRLANERAKSSQAGAD